MHRTAPLLVALLLPLLLILLAPGTSGRSIQETEDFDSLLEAALRVRRSPQDSDERSTGRKIVDWMKNLARTAMEIVEGVIQIFRGISDTNTSSLNGGSRSNYTSVEEMRPDRLVEELDWE